MDRWVWRCSGCHTINDWNVGVCGSCSKEYYSEAKLWECSYCYTINSMDAGLCGKCRKQQQRNSWPT